jgi:FKBP-type peptidyl-prolyl cis-trans isomerase FkpA
MKKTSLFIFSAIAIALAACSPNAGFKKTKSGLKYKIISDEKNSVVKKGQFIKVHFTQKMGDSVLNSSFEGLPTYAPVDSVGPIYNPVEIFPLLRKGDSAVVIMETDSLYKQQAERPPYVKKGDKLTLTFRVVDVLSDEQALRDDQMKIFNEQKAKEVQDIDAYLKKNNIVAQKTEKGTFVVIKEQGTGPVADSGKAVKVMYTGKTFGGKVFDSNVDTTFGHTDPYTLVIGSRGAIEGWDDGLRLFNKGAKGTMYIPSMLAYGGNPPPGAPFKAFENLVFDVHVVDITEAPKRSEMQMPR